MNITLDNIIDYVNLNHEERRMTNSSFEYKLRDAVIFFGGDIKVIAIKDISIYANPNVPRYDGIFIGIQKEGGKLTQDKIDYLDSIVDKKMTLKFVIDTKQVYSQYNGYDNDKSFNIEGKLIKEYGLDKNIDEAYKIMDLMHDYFYNTETLMRAKDLTFLDSCTGQHELFGLGINAYGEMEELFKSSNLLTVKGQYEFYLTLRPSPKSARK